MAYTSDLRGVQFYTGNFLDGQVPGKAAWYARRQGYCFEISIANSQHAGICIPDREKGREIRYNDQL